MQRFSAALKQALPAEDWPTVYRALLSSPPLWARLQEEDFGRLALEKAGGKSENWTPAFFAFVELGLEDEFERIRESGGQIDDDELRFAGLGLIEALAKGEGPEPEAGQELSYALTAAIGLSQRYRLSQDEEGFAQDLEAVPEEVQAAALSCLVGIMPGGESYLKLIAAIKEKRLLTKALRAFFALPQGDDEIGQQFSAIAGQVDAQGWIMLLECLSGFEPKMARELAGSVDLDPKQVRHSKAIKELEGLKIEAQRQSLAGKTDKALGLLAEAWSAGEALQAEIAEQIAASSDKSGNGAEAKGRIAEILASPLGKQSRKAKKAGSNEIATLIASAESALAQGEAEQANEMAQQALAQIQADEASELAEIRQASALLEQTGQIESAIEASELAFGRRAQAEDALRLARLHRAGGNLAAALDFAHVAQGLAPNEREVQKELARAEQANGRMADAFTIWRTVFADFEDAAESDVVALAETAIALDEQEEAARALAELVQRFPANPLGHSLQARLLAAEQPEEAIVAYQQALSLDASVEAIWMELAQLQRSRGEIKAAIETLQEGEQQVEVSAAYLLELANYLLESNQRGEAEAVLARALAKGQEQAEGQVLPAIYLQLSELLISQDEQDKALELLNEAHLLFPKDRLVAGKLGKLLLETGQAQQSAQTLEIAAQAAEEDQELQFELAQAYLQIADGRDKAEKALRAVIKQDPKHAAAAILLAEIELAQGNIAEAKKDLLKLERKLDSFDGDLQRRFGLAKAGLLKASDEIEEAIQTIDELNAQRPEDLEVLAALCDLYRADGRGEEAFQIANHQFLTLPKSAEGLLWFAGEAEASGRSQEGLDALKKGYEEGLTSPQLQLALIKARWQAGKWASEKAFVREIREEFQTKGQDLIALAEFFEGQEAYQAAIDCQKAAAKDENAERDKLLAAVAENYLKLGREEEALGKLDEAIESAPERSRYRVRKSEILEASGQLDSALKTIEGLLEGLPRDARLLARKSGLMAKTGDLAGALSSAKAAIAQQSQPSKELLRGAIHLAMESLQYEQALEWLALIGEKKALDWAFEVEAQLANGGPEAARATLTKAEDESAASPGLMALGARVALQEGQFPAAEAAYRESLREYGKEAPYREAFEDYLIAKAAALLRDWDTALNLFGRLLNSDPDSVLYRLGMAETLLLQAEWEQTCQRLSIHKRRGSSNAAHLAQIESLLKESAAGLNDKEALERVQRLGLRAKLRLAPEQIAVGLPEHFPANQHEAAALEYACQSNEELRKYQQRLKAFTESPTLFLEAALANLKTEPRNAVGLAKRAVEISSEQPELLAALALAQRETGQTQEAIESLQTALAFWPDEAGWYALLADWLDETGDALTAAGYWSEAIRWQPGVARYHFKLGRAQRARGQTAAAMQSLESALGLDIEDSETLLELAELCLEAEDLRGAKRLLRKQGKRADSDGRRSLLESKIELKQGRLKEALSLAQQARKLKPEAGDVVGHYADVLVAMGQRQQAVRLLQRFGKHSRNAVALLIKAIRIQAQLDDGKDVRSAFEALAEKFPESPLPYKELAQVSAQGGDIEAAKGWAEKALKAAGELSLFEKAKLLLFFGRIARETGQLDQSLQLLEQALQITDTMPEIHLEMGKAFAARRQRHSAQAAFEKAAGLAPRNAEAYLLVAKMHKATKDYGQAEAWLRKATKVAPKDAAIQKQLAAVMALNLVNQASKVGAEQ